MSLIPLKSSPLAPGLNPVEIFCRDEGTGAPLILLHGGWGYSLNPFTTQIAGLRDRFRVVCPDRSGYGKSSRMTEGFATDFHYRAAQETLALLDSLNIQRAFFWGHSDGAVISAILGFTAPERVNGLILEAFHYFKRKPASRVFFETLGRKPEALGQELCSRFALEFGGNNWREMIAGHAQAWIRMAEQSRRLKEDLFAGRLSEVRAPVLLLHGRLDPRTEPGELEAVKAALPMAELELLEGAGHSPHSESGFAELTTKLALAFLSKHLD
jgi:pimeloyl-ACP methyl ester carboxylesterase